MATAALKPLHIPGAVARHGEIFLREIISNLEAEYELVGDEWPDGFDPNDISLFKGVLDDILEGGVNGFETIWWWGKPFSFFVHHLKVYLTSNLMLPKDDINEISKFIAEYDSRKSRLTFVNGCFQEN
jgi:hypothetical protein